MLRSVNRMRQRVVKNVAGSGAKWLDVSGERFPGWISSFARTARGSRVAGVTGTDGASGVHGVGRRGRGMPPAVSRNRSRWRARAGPPLVVPETGRDRRGARPRTPGRRAPSASSWSGSAGTRRGYSPATRLRSPTPKPGPAWCTAAARRAAGRSIASPAAGRSRRTRRWTQRRTRRRFGRWKSGIAATGARAQARATRSARRTGRGRAAGKGVAARTGARARPRLDAVVLGGDKRAVAELRDDPRLAPYLATRDGAVPDRPRPEAGRPRRRAEAVPAVRIRLTEPAG